MPDEAFRVGKFRLREVTTEDLDEICAVFESNPDFLLLRAEAVASSGGYEPAAVRQYCEGALLDPGRHLLVVADEESRTTLGLVDFIDLSPADDVPWIGLVIVHRSHQRLGAGTAAVQAVAAHLASQGHSVARMAVIKEYEVGLSFVRSLGCDEYATASVLTDHELGSALLFELALPLDR